MDAGVLLETLINVRETIGPLEPLVTDASVSPGRVLRETVPFILARGAPAHGALVNRLAPFPTVTAGTGAGVLFQGGQFTNPIMGAG